MGKLSDFLASNKDANEEYLALIENARREAREAGVNSERDRLSAIDQIAGNIDQSLVHNAKYDKPVTAETLALEALKQGSFIRSTKEDETQTASPKDDATPSSETAAVNLEQIAKMAADYAISNAAKLQSPAKDPLTGAASSSGAGSEQMAKDASESINRYL